MQSTTLSNSTSATNSSDTLNVWLLAVFLALLEGSPVLFQPATRVLCGVTTHGFLAAVAQHTMLTMQEIWACCRLLRRRARLAHQSRHQNSAGAWRIRHGEGLMPLLISDKVWPNRETTAMALLD